MKIVASIDPNLTTTQITQQLNDTIAAINNGDSVDMAIVKVQPEMSTDEFAQAIEGTHSDRGQ